MRSGTVNSRDVVTGADLAVFQQRRSDCEIIFGQPASHAGLKDGADEMGDASAVTSSVR